MGASHRIAAGALSLALSGLGCAPDPEPDRVVDIRAHFWPRCAPAEGPPLDFTVSALGDFDPDPTTVQTAGEQEPSVSLGLPPETRAVAVAATDGFDQWEGFAEVDSTEVVDLALWPVGRACELLRAGSYPPGNGEAMGKIGRTVLVFGGGDTTASMTGALLTDLDAARVQAPRLDPRDRRVGATVTALGEDLLVAGGRDDLAGPEVLASAEILDVDEGSFETEPLELSIGRVDHAAVTLDSGDTLLVGGRDPEGQPLRTLEVVSDASRRYRIDGLTDLVQGRLGPDAILLDDGRVAIAGGLDAEGRPIQSIEWLSPDATRTTHVLDTLGPGRLIARRAFAPMPAGGLVAAGGCDLVDPEPERVEACEAECGRGGGCPAMDVYWIDRAGVVTMLAPLGVPAPRPRLSAMDAGRPWLSTGSPTNPSLWVFDPWRARFVAAPARVDRAPEGGALQLSTDGKLVWLERGPQPTEWAVRLATRHRFSADTAPLIVSGLGALAPSHPPGRGIDYDAALAAIVVSEPDRALIVGDTTYAGLALEIAAEGPAPVVHLGDAAYGDDRCPWPARSGSAERLRLVREPDAVILRVSGAERRCEAPVGPVPLSLSTPGPELRITSLTIRREPEALPDSD